MDKKAPLKDEIMNRGVETGAGCSEGERWSLERQPIDSKASEQGGLKSTQSTVG